MEVIHRRSATAGPLIHPDLMRRGRRGRSGRRGVIAGAFLTAALLSCTAAPPDAAVELRVMSFNIRYGTANDGENSWPSRNQLVLDVIAITTTPDILGIQEALAFQLDELIAGFGWLSHDRCGAR